MMHSEYGHEAGNGKETARPEPAGPGAAAHLSTRPPVAYLRRNQWLERAPRVVVPRGQSDPTFCGVRRSRSCCAEQPGACCRQPQVERESCPPALKARRTRPAQLCSANASVIGTAFLSGVR